MPEVSLVAIFDADKEGFLRSERSLIQTIGRAARHVNGKAILYADSITPSMHRAMAETERRRAKQIAYNTEHGITPKSATRQITDKIDTGEDENTEVVRIVLSEALQGVDESILHSPKLLAKEIARLEKQMQALSRELKFEEAMKVRDTMLALKELMVKYT